MAYLALYREWRPKRFNDVVGQEHITKTLLNALNQKKVAHAYLFSGPRGTGKTTTAKILAKALNCESPNGVEPCNKCVSCQGIDHGSAMEVFEIDAASNRGIDEIRELRENIKLSAVQGRYKVYIIDEVHMLTTEAFNALLKTLEEPPSQVIFILATTEVQKIPLTILSRVQRFEFHRISLEKIQNRLVEVCMSLNRQIDLKALTVIAQKSEGGLRDALSILDQCLLQDDPIGVEEVYNVLGLVGETYSADLVDMLISSDYGKCLAFLSEGIQQGRDPRQIIRELLDYLRNVLLTSVTGEIPLAAPHIQERLIKQSQLIDLTKLLRWISIILQGEGQLKFASNARLASELLLVQTIHDGEGPVSGQQEETDKHISHEAIKRITNQEKQAKTISPLVQSSQSKSDNSGNTMEVSKDNDLSIGQIQERWNEVLEQVKKLKKSTHAFLLEGKPGLLKDNKLTIVFREGCSFHRDKVDQNENRQTIEAVLNKLFGIPLNIQNIMENDFQSKETSDVENAEEQQEQAVINKVKAMFGSDLVVVSE
jgi:DNA polymerase-3 subunit gamma/tau